MRTIKSKDAKLKKKRSEEGKRRRSKANQESERTEDDLLGGEVDLKEDGLKALHVVEEFVNELVDGMVTSGCESTLVLLRGDWGPTRHGRN